MSGAGAAFGSSSRIGGAVLVFGCEEGGSVEMFVEGFGVSAETATAAAA